MGEEKQGQEAGRDRNRPERQANRAAKNAVSHHGATSAAGGVERVVKPGGQSAQSAGIVKAGAAHWLLLSFSVTPSFRE